MLMLSLGLHAQSVIQFSASTYDTSEGVPEATVHIQRSNDLEAVVSVDLNTIAGTATAAKDYTEVSITLTFLAHETLKTVTIPLIDDAQAEADEVFQVGLNTPTGGAVLGFSTATVRITDDDHPVQLNSVTYTVSEEAGSVEILVVRGKRGDLPITVELTTSDVTATAGTDYVGVTNTLRLEGAKQFERVLIPILNDTAFETHERFRVALGSVTGGKLVAARASAMVTILDTDERVQLEHTNYRVGEADGFVRIGVARGENANAATVQFRTSDASALAGTDYVGLTNTLEFATGERLKLVDISILNDGVREALESFRVSLSDPTGGAVLGGGATGTTVNVVDNDPGVQPEQPEFWVRESDGALAVKVLRENDGALGAFTVDYSTSDGTAIAGIDYEAVSGTLTFGPGQQVATLTIPITADDVAEANESFRLTLSGVTGDATQGTRVYATITIWDTTGARPHRFSGVTVRPDGAVELALDGAVNRRFAPYYDLYPVEVSFDLKDWMPLVTLVRTNASTNTLRYVDAVGPLWTQRFYRTATSHFITPMAKPTGPHPVGVVSRRITDPSRRNRYDISTNGSFMVSLWYPAVARAGQDPGRLEDLELAMDPAWPASWGASPMPDREAFFVSYALPEAPAAVEQAPYPILIHSISGYGARTEIGERAIELASHGYVVVGVDHFDAFTVLPDGTYYNRGSSSPNLASAVGFQDRVRDVRLVLDQLEQWNRNDSIFAGRLDVMNVATMGFSWGGGVAGEVARVDERCRAAIILEGYFQNADDLISLGLSKPTLSIYASPITLSDGSEGLVFNHVSTQDAIWFQVSGINHAQAGDCQWLFGTGELPALREAMRTMKAYTLWFLNKQLKGSADPMPALKDYPRVVNFKQK